MAIPPPPYANIAGTSQIVAKYNEQEPIANVDGNARPGQLIVDLATDPPQLYIGNNSGNITLVASGGGGTPGGSNTYVQFNDAGSFGGVIDFTFDKITNVFTVPGNIVTTGSSGNITGANMVQANTFASTGNLYITPDIGSPTATLEVYLTGGPDVHIAAPNTDNFILGKDVGANVTIGVNGDVSVQSYDGGNATPHTWYFSYLGVTQSPITTYANLPSATVPGLRAFINDANLVASGNFGATLTGGAGNTVPVYSDGADWRIG